MFMNVLFINNFHFRKGGADVVYFNTADLLKKHGHKVLFFSQKSNSNELNFNPDYFIDTKEFLKTGIIRKVLGFYKFIYSFESKRKLKELIAKNEIDIVHIHQYKGILTPSILKVLKSNNIPVIFSLHDYQLLCPHVSFIDGKNKTCERCLNGSSFNCVKNKCNHNNYLYSFISFIEYNFNKIYAPPSKYFARLISVSKFSFNKHRLDSNISSRLVHLYNFFPNLNLVTPNMEMGNYMLFYGRLSKEKGISTLIEAWKKHSHGNNKLIIAGNGPLKEFCMSASDNKSIFYVGYKSGNELKKLIADASFIIVPSEWYENNPLTIIEAYAYGKPVIGSDIGGIPEMIVEGKTGFLFESANPINLFEKINKAEKLTNLEYFSLSTNARMFCEANFSETSHYHKLMEIYTEEINKNVKKKN